MEETTISDWALGYQAGKVSALQEMELIKNDRDSWVKTVHAQIDIMNAQREKIRNLEAELKYLEEQYNNKAH